MFQWTFNNVQLDKDPGTTFHPLINFFFWFPHFNFIYWREVGFLKSFFKKVKPIFFCYQKLFLVAFTMHNQCVTLFLIKMQISSFSSAPLGLWLSGFWQIWKMALGPTELGTAVVGALLDEMRFATSQTPPPEVHTLIRGPALKFTGLPHTNLLLVTSGFLNLSSIGYGEGGKWRYCTCYSSWAQQSTGLSCKSAKHRSMDLGLLSPHFGLKGQILPLLTVTSAPKKHWSIPE